MSGSPQGGPVALVTGAGSGIGRAVSIALHGAGYRLVLAGRRREPLQALHDELLGLAAGDGGSAPALPEVLVVPCDVGRPEAVEQLFAALRARFARLDLLFNNAGTGAPPVPMEELTYAQWMQVVDTNLTGAFLCTQQAMRLMKAQQPAGGRIINNGSISAHTPRPYSAPYTATKHALTGLTRATALDGRAHGIACGQIDIGNAQTDMTQPMAQGALQANGTRLAEARMDVAHVGRAVLQMAQLPLDTNVLFMTLMATAMPYVGRG